MAKFILLNTVIVATTKFFAGQTIDDAAKTDIEAVGGAVVPTDIAATEITAAAAVCEKLRASKAVNEAAVDAIMLAAAAAVAQTQKGIATLVAGEVVVTGVRLTAGSRIMLTRATAGGTVGHLSAPVADRDAGAGEFKIVSSSNTETSTVEYVIVG